MALTVVLPDGRQVRTGSRARKSAAGYDLTRLFVGSEGTLGVITELTVRLYPRPEVVATATCAFPSVRHAVDVVIETSQLGVPIARIELLDEVMIEAVNRYARLQCPVAPTLFFEFHASSDSSVREQVEAVQAVANEHGGSGFEWVTTAEDRARLWKARHDAYYAALALRPGAQAWTTDVCVPISALSECILETRRDMAASSLTGALVGHVGDGNFHIILLVDADRADELAEAERLSGRIVGHALRLQGTCTGEHGIGLGKRTYLIREHGAGVDVMRTIKAALDPDGLMNPGKVFE